MGEGSTGVDAYIQNCPKKAQVRLGEVRKAISKAAPNGRNPNFNAASD